MPRPSLRTAIRTASIAGSSPTVPHACSRTLTISASIPTPLPRQLYHVVNGTLKANDLTGGQLLTTAGGGIITVGCQLGGTAEC